MATLSEFQGTRASNYKGQTSEEWPSILCVDDDPSCVASLERSLRPYKVKLQRAYHGMQGIVKAVEQKPDLVLTDLHMPLATGEELIECLNRNPATSGTPIVAITGHPGRSLTPEFEALGVRKVLCKPLQFEELLAEISELVAIGLK